MKFLNWHTSRGRRYAREFDITLDSSGFNRCDDLNPTVNLNFSNGESPSKYLTITLTIPEAEHLAKRLLQRIDDVKASDEEHRRNVCIS